jgi:hypothetical protein
MAMPPYSLMQTVCVLGHLTRELDVVLAQDHIKKILVKKILVVRDESQTGRAVGCGVQQMIA